MRRLLAFASAVTAAAALAVFGMGAGDAEGEPYLVRAIFDNAGFVIAGEDVKVAGVKVGSIDSLDITEDDKAVVVLRIDEPGYRDFRKDATCSVRPQSLIGEKYVECTPTRPRAVGAAAAPPLDVIDGGPGAGQRLLPVENTTKAVDLDLINNTMRLPQRQRFSIILNELGTGLAGRGSDIREVIRRADPALREIDEVLEILADQNETLTKLASDSDEAIAPLARERRRVTSFIEESSEVAEATAERRTELEADIERLPRFLDELTPTMARLGSFADQATPVLSDLGDRAPAINTLIRELGPFSASATPALETLGEATKVGTPALEDARPVVRDLRVFARQAKPLGRTLADVLDSFQKANGIERAMDYIFYQVAAINGFDSFGHYLRASLIVNTCSSYTATPISGCTANFSRASASRASASDKPKDETLERTARILAGADPRAITPEDERGIRRGTTGAEEAAATPTPAPTATPEPEARPKARPAPAPAEERSGAAPSAEAQDGLLDYLLGREGK